MEPWNVDLGSMEMSQRSSTPNGGPPARQLGVLGVPPQKERKATDRRLLGRRSFPSRAGGCGLPRKECALSPAEAGINFLFVL